MSEFADGINYFIIYIFRWISNMTSPKSNQVTPRLVFVRMNIYLQFYMQKQGALLIDTQWIVLL